MPFGHTVLQTKECQRLGKQFILWKLQTLADSLKQILELAGGRTPVNASWILFHMLLVLISMHWRKENEPPVFQQQPSHIRWVKDECMDTTCSIMKNVSCLVMTQTKNIFGGGQIGSKRQPIFITWVYNLNSFVPWVLDFKWILLQNLFS